MKIGSLQLKVARPANLDEQLIALTGCNAAEIAGHLHGPSLAGSIAAALLPFITGEKPERHTLATQIAKEGVDKIRLQVLALYEKQ